MGDLKKFQFSELGRAFLLNLGSMKKGDGLNLEEFLAALGQPGRYQLVIYVLLCLNYMPVAFNHLAMVFYGATPPHHCHIPDNATLNNESIPYITDKDGHYGPAECLKYFNSSSTADVKCSDGPYDYSVYPAGKPGPAENTIVVEWDLVCDEAYKSFLATTLYFVGVMIGASLFGAMGDWIGRKPTLLLCLYSYLVLGIGLHFVKNYVQFVVLRVFIGMCMQGLQTNTYVLFSEMFVARYRTHVGTMFEPFWGMGVIWLAFVAWLIKDWRYMQLALVLPSALTIVYIWIMPESFRWLFIKNKLSRVETQMKRTCRFNNMKLPDIKLDKVYIPGQQSEHERKHTPLDLVRTPMIRKNTLLAFYVWFATSCVYYGLSLATSTWKGNKYLIFFISGIGEMPAYLAAVFILHRFGRKKPMFVYFAVAGIGCILSVTLPTTNKHGEDISIGRTISGLIGRLAAAGCFSVIFLYGAELFPTVIRSMAWGMCALFGRLGAVIAPQINFAGQAKSKSLPGIVFGCIAILAAFLTLFLPETNKKRLPDTIEEAEAFGRTKDTKPLTSQNLDNESQINKGFNCDDNVTKL